MTSWLAVLLLAGAQTPKITLSYFQEHFIVREGAFNESLPLKLPPENPKLSTLFRRNDTFAVWDERGVTIRIGEKVRSSKLPAIPLSPKAFSRSEILTTQGEMRKGRRSKDAAGLSGSVRVANEAYFLARWEDKAGIPWSEALVSVNLAEKDPQPKFLGRIPELSTATDPIDDKLFILGGKPSYVARNASKWGLAQFDPKTKRLSFEPLGDRLEVFLPLAVQEEGRVRLQNDVGYFIERTAYGTTVAGRMDLKGRLRKVLAEARATMRFLDTAEPPCVIVSFGKQGAQMLNASTGAEYALPDSCAARRCSRGIIVWSPTNAPKKAWLFDPRLWQPRAWWSAGK